MINYRSKLFWLLLFLLLASLGVVWYVISLKSLEINYKNVHDVTVYKTAALNSGKGQKPTAKISASGQAVKLRAGSYTIHYVGDNGYQSKYVAVNVDRKHQEFFIEPEYSDAKLKEFLNAELPSIKAALTNKYPQIGLYNIEPGKLYYKGAWYATVLNYKGAYGPDADSLRVVLHKESGQWVVKTDPPNITLSKFTFPDVPDDILRDVNALPVTIPKPSTNASSGSGGARPRY